MFNWFQKMFRIHEDRIEEVIKELFRFLLDDYGFYFAKSSLGDAVDQNGEFFFYGPLDAYCIYNERLCINVLYLVQRQEYDIYITDAYKADQIYIRNGIQVSNCQAYDLSSFAAEVKNSVVNSGEIYGCKM